MCFHSLSLLLIYSPCHSVLRHISFWIALTELTFFYIFLLKPTVVRYLSSPFHKTSLVKFSTFPNPKSSNHLSLIQLFIPTPWLSYFLLASLPHLFKPQSKVLFIFSTSKFVPRAHSSHHISLHHHQFYGFKLQVTMSNYIIIIPI